MADPQPPSTASIAIATAILSALFGYFAGQAKILGLFSSPSSTRGNKTTNNNDRSESSSSSSEDGDSDAANAEKEGQKDDDNEEEEPDQEFDGFPNDADEHKLVLVVRTDLGMTKGKIAAQASHATHACYKALASSPNPSARALLRRWERTGQAKIAVQCKSEEELELLQAQAVSLGICARVIHDAGRTQIAAGSATVLGVGPAPRGRVDQVTGGLKLL